MMNVNTTAEIDTLYRAMFEKSEMSTEEIVARVALVFPVLVDDWREVRKGRVENYDGICRDALETYGMESQMNLLQEECGELVVAISHHRRGRVTIEKVAEEIADVMIVATQITFGIGPIVVDRFLREKATRLTVKLARHLRGEV